MRSNGKDEAFRFQVLRTGGRKRDPCIREVGGKLWVSDCGRLKDKLVEYSEGTGKWPLLRWRIGRFCEKGSQEVAVDVADWLRIDHCCRRATAKN